MTLIAAIRLHGVPILLGDLLISSHHLDAPHISIPTLLSQDIDAILPHEDSYPVVRKLERKLVKISDWLVVAWTGDLVAAKTVLKSMYARFGDKRATRKDVFAFFENFEDIGTIQCTVLGWIVDKTGTTSFSWNSKMRTVSFNEDAYIDGCGKEGFERNLREVLSKHTNVTTRNDNSKAVLEALGYAGYILGKELATGETIYALYGGGIEVVYFDKGRFRHVNNITYLFWPIEITARDELVIKPSPVILTYRYHRDFLTIRTIRMKFIDRHIQSEANIELYVIPHFCRDEAEFHALHLATSMSEPTYCSNFFFLPVSNTSYITTCLVFDNSSEGTKLIRFDQKQKDDKLVHTVSMSNKLLEIVRTYINGVINTIKPNSAVPDLVE